MESISLRVSPDVLTAKAGELTTEKSTVNTIMDEAKAKVLSLTGVWKSAAADEFQNRFKQIYNDVDNVLAIVTMYINDLTEAAGIFTSAENAAQTSAQGLPVDGVFRV
jgi:WXG100 family type VII secretion target